MDYHVIVAFKEAPALWLCGAPWEEQLLSDFAACMALRGRSRVKGEALAEKLLELPAEASPAKAARALPLSKLKGPWQRWWRRCLLHRAHPDHYEAPDDGAFFQLNLEATSDDAQIPGQLNFAEDGRLAVDIIRSTTPYGPLHAEIDRRLDNPRWNQVIPKELLWVYRYTHQRGRSCKLWAMLPLAFIQGGLVWGGRYDVRL